MVEVQSCDGAYSSLKSLSQRKDIDVIALGSFLGIRIDMDDERLSPMGYVNTMQMYPMDFEEFLWASGFSDETIGSVRSKIQADKPIDPLDLGPPKYLYRI